jgi:LPS-assembly protein
MRPGPCKWLAALVFAFVALTGPAQAQAQEPSFKNVDTPFLLTAETITYDEDLGIVTASGAVEIINEDRILLADKVSYNQKQGVVSASGNVSLMEPTGEVVFAEYIEIDEDLKEGVIKSLNILLADNSRFAAQGARRYSEDHTELAKAVYSPCEICKEDPSRPPLWQIKAKRIIHRRDQQVVQYRDAVLEVMGVPVAYTPYFEHADPSVKRKTGFLVPKFGSTSDLGATLQVPYYWAIAPDRDLTIEPLFTTEEGVVMAGEYRQVTARGDYNAEASLTHSQRRNELNQPIGDDKFRGHIDATGRQDIDDTWTWGFDLERTTDDTYLKRYRFGDADTLTSDLFIEGIDGRNYAAASMYAFQGLDAEDDRGTTPYVAPLLDYALMIDPTKRSTLELSANAVSLYRTEGLDTRRISLDSEWRLPFISPMGDVYTVTAALGADGYWLNDYVNPGQVQYGSRNESELRVSPLLAMDWRYPWVRHGETSDQVIEPVVQLIAAPYGGNPSDIPNEDSLALEFDDTSLFSLNRFPGYDRVESGPRANVGVRASAYGNDGGYATLVVGEVFRLRDDDTFPTDSGLDDNRSDFVAAITLAPSPYFDLTHRIRVDHDGFRLRRNEVYVSMGPEYLRLVTNYVKLDQDLSSDQLTNREELYNSLNWKFFEFWTAYVESRRDLTNNGNQIRTAAGLQYLDECFGFRVDYERRFTRDRDIEPSQSINFRIVLRNLG